MARMGGTVESWLLIGGPILATALLIGLIRVAAGRRPAPALDADRVRARLAQDWQDFVAGSVWLAADGSAGLATDAGGTPRLGLVYGFGDKLPSRLIGPGEVVEARLADGLLAFTLRDFARPRFRLPAAGDAAPWLARLAALQPAPKP